jgi:hypothetical protein
MSWPGCRPGRGHEPPGAGGELPVTGGVTRPMAWNPAAYVLKGAGRLPLDEAERAFLGDRARAFPAPG